MSNRFYLCHYCLVLYIYRLHLKVQVIAGSILISNGTEDSVTGRYHFVANWQGGDIGIDTVKFFNNFRLDIDW